MKVFISAFLRAMVAASALRLASWYNQTTCDHRQGGAKGFTHPDWCKQVIRALRECLTFAVSKAYLAVGVLDIVLLDEGGEAAQHAQCPGRQGTQVVEVVQVVRKPADHHQPD